LDRKGYIKGTKVMGGAIPFFQISHSGFDQYLRRVFSGYDAIYEQVCLAILNENLTQNVQIAQRLNQSISIIDHVMNDLNNKGLVHTEGFLGGGLIIFNVYPELKRMFRR
jgi:predicted transcriptional regulator